MDVYVAPEVSQVISLHVYLRDPDFRALPIKAQLEQQADTIRRAHKEGDRRVLMHLASWWPNGVGLSDAALMGVAFSAEDARHSIAREYGYKSWDAVEALSHTPPNAAFEAALDTMLAGDRTAFEQALTDRPALAAAKSDFGHRATLLHYLGANGVETHRQVMPRNAPDLAELLLALGADRLAHAHMYGGNQTAFALAETSAHPYNAGVCEDLLRVLRPD